MFAGDVRRGVVTDDQEADFRVGSHHKTRGANQRREIFLWGYAREHADELTGIRKTQLSLDRGCCLSAGSNRGIIGRIESVIYNCSPVFPDPMRESVPRV